ncbi:hypothetical protein ACFPN7_08780 [Amycolatopsis halotolerans]|uniref:hypothetical protein n=1 Tax=Amycolatopsis halotolerans TaxID=330083 RepID=UPI003621354F
MGEIAAANVGNCWSIGTPAAARQPGKPRRTAGSGGIRAGTALPANACARSGETICLAFVVSLRTVRRRTT